jgi:hypothetical protein
MESMCIEMKKKESQLKEMQHQIETGEGCMGFWYIYLQINF